MAVTTGREALIRARLTAGLSRREAARVVGISRTALENAEDGKPVRMRTARTLASFYGRGVLKLFPDLGE